MAPVDNSPTGSMSGFQLICSFKSNESIPVHKYKSVNTGLTVFIADVDGPLVCGFFCLATEAFDDDGLPHTLEHLVFIGSEKYPYKGVLDLVANRCLASGTNAWTETHHTAYTMKTAGSEGFLSLMPIYLEHILFPTLTESAYKTEVHHITGEGKDAGIVYSEMQGCMNTGEEMTYMKLLRALYPGKCGYKSYTGGALENLRESTSNEKVRNYHKEYYRPENLTIIITGQVKHTEVFKALQGIEEKILSKGSGDLFKKPWQGEVEALAEKFDFDVFYPCDDEDNGMVIAGWQGSSINDYYKHVACTVLLRYLTNTSVSPLQQEFVEIDDPFANDVDSEICENSTPLYGIRFDNVPKEKIPLIKDRLINTLKEIGSKDDGIDMKRMAIVVQKSILEIQSGMESSPDTIIVRSLVNDILFGNSNEDLNKRLNLIDIFRKLQSEPASFWLNLLNKQFVDAPFVFTKGIPSIKKKIEMTKEEEERIEKQKQKLGDEGLKKKEKELEEAIAENEKPVPDEILTSVPIPGTDSINFHYIKSFSTDSLEQHPRFDVNKLPLYTYLDHANTNFVYLFVTMDTSKVPENLRPYIPILLELLLVSPVNRDGKLIPYTDIVNELESDTIQISSGVGVKGGGRFSCGTFSQGANLILQVEIAKYAKGVQWIKELLYDTEFTPERLKVNAAKILNEVSSAKREGNLMTSALLKGLLYKTESNQYTLSVLRQQKFLTKMLERLETNEGMKEVTSEINQVRKILTMPNFMALHMAFNVDKLVAQNPNVYAPWKEFFCDVQCPDKSKLKIHADHEFINPLGNIALNGCVTGLGCIESAFMVQCTPSIKDFMHPDKAALMVYLQYLTQLEGPMWKKIRGQGHAYSYGMSVASNEGHLYFTLYRAVNIINAYKEARAIMEMYLNQDNWDSILFDSAKSSLIFEIINSEKTVQGMIGQSLLSNYFNIPHDYNRQLVKNVSSVTLDDVHRIAPQYIKKLLDPKACTTSIVCHPSKVEEIAKAFSGFGYDLKAYNSLDETHLNE
ncbi:uncharacterized protein C05D11.1-like [Leptopilina heterotoma]|uniref:uncharacterized protein C05D11.1-like n=1 Tax=Leptopilina heterotoma TaxID=63436 RepID=UPI001CAA340A|nr:uncharacterized protein C05D11.1-like [Leptopilina heterotoma]